jgi:hypothetical protein
MRIRSTDEKTLDIIREVFRHLVISDFSILTSDGTSGTSHKFGVRVDK